MVLQLAEILFAQAEERCAVHFGGTTDKIVDTGLERLALLIIPGIFGSVAPLNKNLFCIPVFLFPGKKVAAFQQ